MLTFFFAHWAVVSQHIFFFLNLFQDREYENVKPHTEEKAEPSREPDFTAVPDLMTPPSEPTGGSTGDVITSPWPDSAGAVIGAGSSAECGSLLGSASRQCWALNFDPPWINS